MRRAATDLFDDHRGRAIPDFNLGSGQVFFNREHLLGLAGQALDMPEQHGKLLWIELFQEALLGNINSQPERRRQ